MTSTMFELTSFITQSLSPALAISATGMLALSMHNRLSTIGGRVRQLNKERFETINPRRKENVEQQIRYFLERGYLMRNALIFLYTAIGFMVITAFLLAIAALNTFPILPGIPIGTFLTGITCIFVAILIEAYEVAVLLKALQLDVDFIPDVETPDSAL